MGYHISSKLALGFNIDLIGFSFVPESTIAFRSDGLQTPTNAKPTVMNILLEIVPIYFVWGLPINSIFFELP